MRKKLLKILKIVLIGFGIILLGLIGAFYYFSIPKSDEKVNEVLLKESKKVFISYGTFKDYEFRILATQLVLDTLKTTLVFIHGSVGSALDFKKYLLDDELNKKFNLITYDRIGYGVNNAGKVKASIKFEADMLDDLLHKKASKKYILVGYSYGGPIALAAKQKCESIILLAPAVYGKIEPMPWLLNIYEWKLTRWLLPDIWKSASKEKLSHRIDLKNYEKSWHSNNSKIVSIHGNDDWIVPYENSIYLKNQFLPKQFELVTLPDAGHALVWTHFEKIKDLLLKQ